MTDFPELSMNTEFLEMVASNLPEDPPLAPEGQEATVRDLLPDLTEKELDYVMSKYKGSMKRGSK